MTDLPELWNHLKFVSDYKTLSPTQVEKIKKSRNKYSLLNYYSSVKILCLDELGYVFPSQDQANDIFQIISKRSELLPTIITTNLVLPTGAKY